MSTRRTPQQQPLLQPSDITFLGTITAPPEVGYGPAGMAVQGQRWFYGGFELTLPALGGTGVVVGRTKLPNTDMIDTANPVVMGGVLPWGSKRIYSVFGVYDASGKIDKSHYVAYDDGRVDGPYTVTTPRLASLDPGWVNSGKRAGMVGGFMGYVPPEWQALFGGPALTGQCCISIVWRTSAGPTASVFNPDHVGSQNPIPSAMAVGYPDKHHSLGQYEYLDSTGAPTGAVSQWYGGTDMYGAVAFPAGTRTVMFVGRRGASMAYGVGTNILALHLTRHPQWTAHNQKFWVYDPSNSDQGAHGPLYTPIVTAYDANDLLAVLQGIKEPWEVAPYAQWALPSFPVGTMQAPEQNRIRGAFYDPATGRLYVGQEGNRVVYVYQVAAGSPPVPVDCQETPGPWGPGAPPGGWTEWAAAGDGKETRRRERTWTQTQPAKDGGIACVWSAPDGTPGFERVIETRDAAPTISVITATVTASSEAAVPIGSTLTVTVQR